MITKDKEIENLIKKQITLECITCILLLQMILKGTSNKSIAETLLMEAHTIGIYKKV